MALDTPSADSREYYTITDLTREFGVSTRTIRFYEDEGLISPQRRGRTRLFREADRRLLSFILRGKRLGFSIAEIREIIHMYKEPPGEAGQLKLLELRARAQAQLGARFELAAFHALVLERGALPLTLLEREVDAWIARA